MTATPGRSRRAFIRQAGAAMSVPLAAAGTSLPAEAAAPADPLQARLRALEDLESIRALNAAYDRAVHSGDRDAAAALAVDPAAAHLDPGVRALTPDPAVGDAIHLADDGRTATARLHRIASIETAIADDGPLVAMARQQGGGVVRRSQAGVLEVDYVRHEGVWKIARAAFRGV